MLDRVEVDIIHVRREILVVADRVLPEAPLPDAAFLAAQARLGAPLASGQTSGEDRLDQPPACREIGVGCRQGPNAMEMLGEHYPRVDRERVASADDTNRVSQEINVPCQQVIAASFQEIDGKEVTASWYAVTSVIGDGDPLLLSA